MCISYQYLIDCLEIRTVSYFSTKVGSHPPHAAGFQPPSKLNLADYDTSEGVMNV